MSNEFINEIIRSRRSVYPPQYNEKPISKEFLDVLLENANWAPTHKLTEPWRFKVIRGTSKSNLGDFLSDTYTDITADDSFSPFKYKKIKNNCESANVIIAICIQKDLKNRLPEWEEVAATAMAVQNMWLTCTANDIGCYWSSPGLIRYMDGFFDFKEGERCLGFLYLGYFNSQEGLISNRSPVGNKVEWLD